MGTRPRSWPPEPPWQDRETFYDMGRNRAAAAEYQTRNDVPRPKLRPSLITAVDFAALQERLSNLPGHLDRDRLVHEFDRYLRELEATLK